MPVGGGLDELRIRWNRAESICSGVDELRLRSTFADVDIVCAADGAVLKAHQFLLARYSALLAGAFDPGPCCCKTKGFRKEDATLVLDDTRKETAQSLLDLIYVGQSSFATAEDKEAFHALAARLGVIPTGVAGISSNGGNVAAAKKRKLEGQQGDDDDEESAAKKAASAADEDKTYRCCHCSYEAASRKELLSHSVRCSRSSNAGKSKDGGKEEFVTSKYSFELITVKEEPLEEASEACVYCGEAVSDREALLLHFCQSHFRTHLYKSFGHLPACPCCGKTFPDDDDTGLLLWHLGVEHRKVEKFLDLCAHSDRDLSCPDCHDDFDSPETLAGHLAVAHYKSKLEKMYPAAKVCPVCQAKIANPTLFLGHLVSRHAVIFKVVPPALAQQLRRLQDCSPAISTAVDFSHGVPMEEVGNPNLICPICDRSFQQESELRVDLALHYLPALQAKFGETTTCHLCHFVADVDDVQELLVHLAIEHDQLSSVVPPETKRLLRGSGIFQPLPCAAAAAPHPTTAHQQQYQATLLTSLQCPACQNLFTRRACFDRHVVTSHLRSSIGHHVSGKQCLMCKSLFSDARQALVHVGRMHGFLERYLKKHMGEELLPPEQSPHHPKALKSASPRKFARALQGTATADDGGHPKKRLVCPLCKSASFKKWATWKKHLYSHVRDKLQQQYSYVNGACPYCPKKLASHAETIFHIGVGHNKVFAQLPKGVLEQLKADGLTTNPSKRTYICPVCPGERKIVGQYNFTYHLFSHWEVKVRERYGRYGNSCFFCRRTAKDLHDNLRHIALDHDKLVDFIPDEVVEDLRGMGVFEKKGPRAGGGGGGAEEVQEERDPIATDVPKLLKNSGPGCDLDEDEEEEPGFTPSENRRNFKRLPKPSLYCPVCARSNFQTRQDLQTHLMAAHYKKEFLRLYGRYGLACPYCKRRYPSQINCLRHIAGAHNKLKRVLPGDVLQTLKENGVLVDKYEASSSSNANGQQKSQLLPGGPTTFKPKMVLLEVERDEEEEADKLCKLTNVSCPVCSKEVLRGKLMIHLTHHYRKELRNAHPDQNEKTCKLCLAATFVSRDAYVSHMGGVHAQVMDFLRPDHRDAVAKLGISSPPPRRNRRTKEAAHPPRKAGEEMEEDDEEEEDTNGDVPDEPPTPDEESCVAMTSDDALASASAYFPEADAAPMSPSTSSTTSVVDPGGPLVCPICSKEVKLVKAWKTHLLKHFASSELLTSAEEQRGGKQCLSCPHREEFATEGALLRHVAFTHYRIFPHVDRKTRALILDTATAAAIPPAAAGGEEEEEEEEEVELLRCCKCRFQTSDAGELSTHLVCHYYEELRNKYVKEDDVCKCPKCDFRADSAFDLVVHVGVAHMKLVLVATLEVNRLFLSTVTLTVGEVTKDASSAFVKMRRKVGVAEAAAAAGLTVGADLVLSDPVFQ